MAKIKVGHGAVGGVQLDTVFGTSDLRLRISFPEANALQADIRKLLGEAGVTIKDAV